MCGTCPSPGSNNSRPWPAGIVSATYFIRSLKIVAEPGRLSSAPPNTSVGALMWAVYQILTRLCMRSDSSDTTLVWSAFAGFAASTIVGPWGKILVSIGLLISVLGNYLAWSLLAAEVVYSAAHNRTMPAFLARENENKAPVAALWLTNAVIQLFLLVTWFAEYAFALALKLTSAMTLIPYLLVAAYGLKLAWTG